MKTPLERLRVIGMIEAISYLLLLGVAMPLKYLANKPEMVSIVGGAHGFLWIAYLIVLVLAWRHYGWPFMALFWGGVASVLPFGPFVFDRWVSQSKLTAD